MATTDAASRAELADTGPPVGTDLRRSTFWLAAIAAAVAVLGNLQILHQFFFADDFANLFEVANDPAPWEFLTMPALGHMHIIRNAALYLNFLTFRMHASWFFATMLANHLVNVLLLFAVARRFTGSSLLACFSGVLFAISPENPGTLGWYAVNGHAIATTFVLAMLLLLVEDDDRRSVGLARALAIAACALGASQSFGNGAAIALALPLVALLLRPTFWRNPMSALVLCLVPCLVALAMWLMTSTKTRLNPSANLYTGILLLVAKDWRHVLPMLFHLASVGSVTLLLGSAYPLERYPDALSALVTLGCLAALVVGFLAGTRRDRRRLVALLLMCLVSYGSIAVGRATMIAVFNGNTWVSTIAHASRYYYLSQAVFAVLVATLLAQLLRRGGRAGHWGTAIPVVWMGCVVVGQLLWPTPADDFEYVRSFVVYLRGVTDAEMRRTPPGSIVCVPNQPAPLGEAFPGTFGVYVLYHPSDEFEGRRVYFTSSNPRELALRIPGSRALSLLVPEGECPPGAVHAAAVGNPDASASAP
jgi:biotin transporter BioY